MGSEGQEEEAARAAGLGARRGRRPRPQAVLCWAARVSPRDIFQGGAAALLATTGGGPLHTRALGCWQGPVSWTPHKTCCSHIWDESMPLKEA